MELNTIFKKQAYRAALVSFIRVCKQEKVYIQILEKITPKPSQKGRKNQFLQVDNTTYWDNVADIIMPEVENTLRHPSPIGYSKEVDYLIHSVNAFVRTFIEELSIVDNNGNKIPPEPFGRKVFDLAHSKLFGTKFEQKIEPVEEGETFNLGEPFHGHYINTNTFDTNTVKFDSALFEEYLNRMMSNRMMSHIRNLNSTYGND